MMKIYLEYWFFFVFIFYVQNLYRFSQVDTKDSWSSVGSEMLWTPTGLFVFLGDDGTYSGV